ncbi:MAG TPA: hypothetical protein VFA59_08460 [Vicinamibacterales bacterium]|nr:hypothetical protein [Vicinamibacterales bacterium]
MMRVTIPTAPGNAAVKSGRINQVLGEAMARMKPETAYFTADQGVRTAYFFVDMKDQTQLPAFAEPFFQEFDAKVEFQPCMNGDDLKSALSQLKV